MITVFISHSSHDEDFVRHLVSELERDGQIRCWHDERQIPYGGNIVEEISNGLQSEFFLFVVSQAALESAWTKEEWTDAFWQQTNNRGKTLGVALLEPCPLPPLLRNKRYFDLTKNRLEGIRQIRGWLLSQAPAPPTRYNLLPSRPPLLVGRGAELLELRSRLQSSAVVAVPGRPGQGKTTLALEFAHRYQQDFEAVYWLSCHSGSLPAITTDWSRQLGIKLDLDLEQLIDALRAECARRRCLVILDNAEDELLGKLIPGGGASVLVTTRKPGLGFLRGRKPLDLGLFTLEQCLELFKTVLGATEVDRHEQECRRLFERVGRLPLAVDVLANLIKYDARHTIASIAANLPRDATALIQDAVAAVTPPARDLLAAMAACAPEGFRLSLAASLIDRDETAALDALHELLSRSLIDELDRGERRYRLHALIRHAADGSRLAHRHAEAVAELFKGWEANWQRCEQDRPDFETALDWALKNPDEAGSSFAGGLAYNGFELNRRIGHPTEALDICQRLADAAERADDKQSLQAWLGNQALILKAWGRLEEALALHHKEEALCQELGDKGGLSISYGNQALILKAWGRLEEALALHHKEEALCYELDDKEGLSISYGNQALILKAWGRLEEALALHRQEEALYRELGDKDGLQRTYGNQALILKAWGRLEEALALLQKQETLCQELGNKDGLQASYGNQALILKAWGRLEEALALHHKEEALCVELGNKDGLQVSYGNQALILQAWGRLEEALALHHKEEALCRELGNKDGLSISYGNQALILKAWGRLEEALALVCKQEALSRELGNKAGLGYCYWNWGLLARAQKDHNTEGEKLHAALALFTELKMPRERDAVAAELGDASGASA